MTFRRDLRREAFRAEERAMKNANLLEDLLDLVDRCSGLGKPISETDVLASLRGGPRAVHSLASRRRWRLASTTRLEDFVDLFPDEFEVVYERKADGRTLRCSRLVRRAS